MGISKTDVTAQNLPLPCEDYFAETEEEELIMYADKFHSKNPQFNSFESYSEHISKFGEDKVKKFAELAEKFGVPELNELAQKYNQPIKEGMQFPQSK